MVSNLHYIQGTDIFMTMFPHMQHIVHFYQSNDLALPHITEAFVALVSLSKGYAFFSAQGLDAY